SGIYTQGEAVTITAPAAPAGQHFKEWTGADSLTFTAGSKTTETATFTIPNGDVTITATYGYELTVTSGSGSGIYSTGEAVTITAPAAPPEQQFKEWTWTGTDSLAFTAGSKTSITVTFNMPSVDVNIEPKYEPITHPSNPIVTVINGTGSESYAPGTPVTITANAAPTGQHFKEWTGTDGLTFTTGSTTTETVTFTMPNHDVTLTATYGYHLMVHDGEREVINGYYGEGEHIGTIIAPDNVGGKSFIGWIWQGPENFSINSGNDALTFNMPAGNLSVEAVHGGCYVATAVYGSYDCPEVWTLRRFRDKVLAKTWYGRLFIRLYYAVSPTAVRLFGQTALFQNFFRGILDPWVADLQSDGFESTPYNDIPW
ncbi:MAG: hypothetical protein IKR84_06310, partial [Oscillibacter sp.]|nr:hypothetical protein [Oscillibacter sp.]